MTDQPPKARRPKPPAAATTAATPAPKPATPTPRTKKAGPAAKVAPKRAATTAPKVAAAAKSPAAGKPSQSPTAAVSAAPGPRRIWISGATGFVGKAVVRVLRTRGDEVIAAVRDARKAEDLVDMGVTVVEDDLSDVAVLTEQLRDVDAVIHSAGSYRVGIGREERGAMWDANIGTTTRVLDAAEAARTPRIVYVSTVGVFGNTHGRVVDEAYRRNIREGFLSWYDETKFGAHEVAAQRSRAGAPIVIVQPSQVYGPGDYTEIGNQLRLAHAGKLPYRAFSDVGLGFVQVDDLAGGIVAALDRGPVPATYILSGPRHRLGEALEIAARLGGRSLPRMAIPNAVLRLAAPVGRFIGQPNLREVVAASAGVTYWASADKAARDLGFAPRSLEDGLRDMFELEADRAYTRS
jgi:nucleoside-diphosphate-sugar epimerase